MEAGLSLASHYVDVRLVRRQTLIGSGKNANKCLEKDLVVIGDAERRLGSLARSQVFETSTGAKPKRSIVLLGNAGMGKSTLIKRLCVDWSDGLLPQFDFVFLLDGKALTLPPEPTYSLQSLLLHLSSSSSPIPSTCPHPQDVFNQVLSVPERVLVIFDGFEVVRDLEGLLQCPADDSKGETYSVRQLFSGLLQRKLLPGCSLLLSARPRGNVSGLLRRADSLLELSGFSPPDIERYLGLYFSGHSLETPASHPIPVPTSDSVPAPDPVPTSDSVPAPVPTSDSVPAPVLVLALARLHSQPYLLSVCWNPALCHMVCLLLEHWEGSEPVPSTLTGLCHRVLALKTRLHTPKKTRCQTLPQTQTQAHTHIPKHSQKHVLKHTQNRTPTHIHTRSRSQSQIQLEEEKREEEEREEGENEREERNEEEREEEENRCVLSELSGLAWQGVKGQSSLLTLTLENTVYVRLRWFGLKTGLVHSNWPGGGGHGDGDDTSSDNILSWAHPFLQSFLGGAHLSVSSCVSDRALLAQILPQVELLFRIKLCLFICPI
uniref:NACHT domain-containing protein n=1 Tax=Hucho hucho TaxID=62062 RepID=A0A4W5LC31_9TELE